MGKVMSEFGTILSTMGSDIQVSTMPTADATNVGKIVQYVGGTSGSYTNGYFYKCVSDGAVTPTYSWQQINVQEENTLFIVNATYAEDHQTHEAIYSVDVTPAELSEAYNAGKNIFLKADRIVTVDSEIYSNGIFNVDDIIEGHGEFYATFSKTIFKGTTSNTIKIRKYEFNLEKYYSSSVWNKITFTASDSDEVQIPEYVQYVDLDTDCPPSAANVGKIVQSIGSPEQSDYTNGYFYKCVYDEDIDEYIWQQIDVQPVPSSIFTITYTQEEDPQTGEWTDSVDKTPAEVIAAYESGAVLQVFYTYRGIYVPFDAHSDDENQYFHFSRLYLEDTKEILIGVGLIANSTNTDWEDYYIEYHDYFEQIGPLPTADEFYWGRIVQYIGETTANYTEGHFYKCVRTGTDPNYTFEWQQINVQPASSGSGAFTITLTGSGTQADPYVADKTPAEVIAAYEANQVVQVSPPSSFFMGEVIVPLFTYMKSINILSVCFECISIDYSNPIATHMIVELEAGTNTTWDEATWSYISFREDDYSVQRYTLPTANEEEYNYHNIFQYIGDTDANYTNGYFYKCVRTGTDPNYTYSWQRIDVQPGTDISGKADKVSGATNGNFAGLDANGNLTDSGKKASDFLSGTVSVGSGGTGATTLTSGAALIGNGTGAVTTRAITNNTAKTTAPTGSTNLATMNSLLYGMQNYNNRASAVNAADTNYTTAMARAIYATTTDLTAGTTALTNGTIAIVYE